MIKMTNKNLIRSIFIGIALTAAMSVSSFAGQWKLDDRGWWYQNDDGTYPAAEWKWIDGNVDGTAECYYFYSDGYMAYSNEIDGYHVNEAGQWVVGGRVQQKTVAGGASSASSGRDMSYAQYCRGEASARRSQGCRPLQKQPQLPTGTFY